MDGSVDRNTELLSPTLPNGDPNPKYRMTRITFPNPFGDSEWVSCTCASCMCLT